MHFSDRTSRHKVDNYSSYKEKNKIFKIPYQKLSQHSLKVDSLNELMMRDQIKGFDSDGTFLNVQDTFDSPYEFALAQATHVKSDQSHLNFNRETVNSLQAFKQKNSNVFSRVKKVHE